MTPVLFKRWGLAGFVLFGLALVPHARAQEIKAASTPGSPWVVRCAAEDAPARDCEMFQRLVIKETGQRVAEFAIGFPPGQKDARGVIVLPLGIVLSDGLELVIDGNQRFRFKVRYCVTEGCFAFLRLNSQLLTALKRGNEALIEGHSLTGQSIKIGFSLAGFTKTIGEIAP